MRMRGRIRQARAALGDALRRGVSPTQASFALAAGIFIAFVPLVGVHTVMALGVAFLLRLNPLIVLLGTQVSNPLTFPLQLFVSVQAGHLLLHGSFVQIEFSSHTDWIGSYLLPLALGSAVLGVVFSVVLFFGSHRILRRWTV